MMKPLDPLIPRLGKTVPGFEAPLPARVDAFTDRGGDFVINDARSPLTYGVLVEVDQI